MHLKYFVTIVVLLLFSISLQSQERKINVVVIGAHPDDADISAGGTAIKFAQMGHNVLFVSLTNGDAGHQKEGGGALGKRRRAEAEEAGRRFGVTYKVLDYHDAELLPTLEARKDVIKLIREWNADIVMGHRPYDYHPDHRNAAIILQDAAFLVTVPNVVSDTPALKKNPVFLYLQDRFQKPYPFSPDIVVDISEVIDQKIYAMSAHESQFFEWLPWLSSQEVPEGDEERVAWLKSQRIRTITPSVMESLIKWYGEEHGSKISIAEAFEICEYGRTPSVEEIRELFPMIK